MRLALDLDSFFLAVHKRRDPLPLDLKPVVLYSSRRHLRQSRAKALGVQKHMRPREAGRRRPHGL